MSGDPDYIYNLFNLNNQVVILTGGMGKLGTNYAEVLVEVYDREQFNYRWRLDGLVRRK